MTRTKIIDGIIAVVLAVALWAYVINVVNPPDTKTIRDVPVSISGQEYLTRNKLAIAGEPEYTVDVVVGGSRAELVGVTADSLTASADISSLSAGQNYINVSVAVPDNLTIEDIRSQKIQVYVDELVIQDKPLNIVYGSAGEGYETAILRYDSDVVAVSGAKSLVDMVSEVRVDLDVTNLAIDAPRTQQLEGLPLDAEGNIVNAVKLSSEGIGITAAIYSLKTVPLEVTVSGAPAYKANVRAVEAPDSITIKGPSTRLESIDKISCEELHIEGIKTDMEYSLTPKLPTGVFVADGSPEFKAAVSLVNVGQITYSYSLTDIMVEGLEEEYELAIEDDADLRINVTAHGTLQALDKLRKNSLQPLIDLSFLEPGGHEVMLESSYEGSDIMFDFNPSILTVEIKAPVEEEPEAEGITPGAIEEGGEPAEDGETEDGGEEEAVSSEEPAEPAA